MSERKDASLLRPARARPAAKPEPDLLGLAGAFAAISLTTLQALMLSTRVYAYASPLTFIYASLLAALFAPLFFVALGALSQHADGEGAEPLERAVAAACAFVMAFVVVLGFDASLDNSSPQEVAFVVAERHPATSAGEARPAPAISLEAGLAAFPFAPSGLDDPSVVPGKTRVVVPLRSGLFGIAWFPAADYRLEER